MQNLNTDEVANPFDFKERIGSTLLENIFFTPADVKKLLENLNSNKTMGPDEIHPRILKESAEIIYLPLYCILRTSLDQGKVPEAWKLANVSPIFKKGDTTTTGNYRPVSLTSHVSKICEKLVKRGMINFIERGKIICNEQHGFRSGRSCLTNLLTTLEDLTRFNDEGVSVDVLYLDFRKAFDSVPHCRLISKLRGYGISGKLISWLEDFLRGRKQRVCIGDAKSEWADVSSGVPQGSVLGPVLFLLYINDLPNEIAVNCQMFADDAKMYQPIRSLEDHSRIQDDLDSLSVWSKQWLLAFNEDKCKVLHIGKKNPCYSYDMNGKVLDRVSGERDLGVFVTESLSFSTHIATTVAKANRMLGLIKHTFSFLDKDSLLLLYKTYVRPHLEYCVQAWSPYLEKDKVLLEKVQRRATKLVPELKELSYEDRLKGLGLTTLETRRERADMIEMFKVVRGLEQMDPNTFFTRREYRGLRGHDFTMKGNRIRLNSRKFSFSNRVISLWNSLPGHVVLAANLDDFKKNYDSYYTTSNPV